MSERHCQIERDQLTAILLCLSEIIRRKAILVKDNKVCQHPKSCVLVAKTIQQGDTYDPIVSITPTSRYE